VNQLKSGEPSKVSSKQDKQEETKTSGTSEKDSKTDASEK